MSVNTVKQDGSLQRIAGGLLYADAPVGTISPFGGSTVPSGYLLCNGQAVNRTTYAELFAVIGTAFGKGDESTTFNVPDLREATTKGVGLSGKSSNHYDLDGVALGEFIEDRVQDHVHRTRLTNTYHQSGDIHIVPVTDDGQSGIGEIGEIVVGRHGATTEVKAVGVNYIIKAKQVAVPADFKDAIDDAIKSELTPSIVLRTSSISRGYAVFYLPKGVTAAKAVLLDILGYTLVTGSCNLVHYTQFSSEAWYVTTASLNTGFNTNLIDGDTIIIKIELTY